MFGSGRAITFHHTIEGTWGECVTPAGHVAYLMTKARLGEPGADFERRLTPLLRPAREIVKPQHLGFDPLFQREIDDHRVATRLLPDLLGASRKGPTFFPPITAALLPLNGSTPSAGFPDKDYDEVEEVDGVTMRTERFGEAYRVRRLIDPHSGTLHRIQLGRVSWSDEHAKLIILDGQHRAMALAAIDRTVNDTWTCDNGASVRHIYAHRVKALLERAGDVLELDRVEVPVTVCWFPRMNGEGTSPYMAARKICVDIHQGAGRPDTSRQAAWARRAEIDAVLGAVEEDE